MAKRRVAWKKENPKKEKPTKVENFGVGLGRLPTKKSHLLRGRETQLRYAKKAGVLRLSNQRKGSEKLASSKAKRKNYRKMGTRRRESRKKKRRLKPTPGKKKNLRALARLD